MFMCECWCEREERKRGDQVKEGQIVPVVCLFKALSLQEMDFPPFSLLEYSIDLVMINCRCQGLIGYVEH